MSRTYRAPRKFSISGKVGKLKIKVRYPEDAEANLILHGIEQKKKLDRQRHKDRQWKLAAAAAADPCLLRGR